MMGRGGGSSTLQLALRAYLSAAHPQRIWEPLPLRMNQKPLSRLLYSVLADGQPGALEPQIQV